MTVPDGPRRDQGSTEDRKEAAGSNRKALTKRLKALDLLLDRKALRTSDAAAILGTDKGSASRLLQTRAQAGHAPQAEGRSFSLGPKLVGRPIPGRPRRSLRERARLKAYAEKIIVDPAQFKAELQRIAEQGYELQDEDYCGDVEMAPRRRATTRCATSLRPWGSRDQRAAFGRKT